MFKTQIVHYLLIKPVKLPQLLTDAVNLIKQSVTNIELT